MRSVSCAALCMRVFRGADAPVTYASRTRHMNKVKRRKKREADDAVRTLRAIPHTRELALRRISFSAGKRLLCSASATGATSNTSDVVTSFGVDTPTVSFGRATNCSVRLYYSAVSPVHARIVFSTDSKAFLEVLGAAGVSVDGCLPD
ncbi:hypothetical protein FB451DRAFT_1390983 [Mycena latifolia]|nr:hypothetical protein FB451DRAFT_1390983 [Mycena latifolia]